jgi:phosphatidylserine/phosphatidylglycerophosphate/cardiolipin synthase-like enzyme
MVEPHFQFYAKPEYFADIIARLNAAKQGERFLTANMVMQPADPSVAPIVKAMMAAARRGVNVALITDAHNFLRRNSSAPARALSRALDELSAAGVRCVVTNRPAGVVASAVAGRAHMKFTVIGRRFYVGGCNLERLQNIDMMAAAENEVAADWLAALGDRLIATGRTTSAIGTEDVTLKLGPATTLFVDAGQRGRSIILSQALSLIDTATSSVFLASQYFPGDVTARHLKAAWKRGVKIHIVYNHPTSYQPFSNRLLHSGYVLAHRVSLPKEFFAHAVRRREGYLHAKLLATDQGAIIGSHNFVSAGVRLGTAELAVRQMDTDFSRRAIQTVLKQLPGIASSVLK